MAVTITITLAEREADALLRAFDDGRQGWHSRPSIPLQTADAKIAQSIVRERMSKPADPSPALADDCDCADREALVRPEGLVCGTCGKVIDPRPGDPS